jgi:hypothetical protein
MTLIKLIAIALSAGVVACSARTATEPAAVQESAEAALPRISGMPGVDMTKSHASAAAESLSVVKALVAKGRPQSRGFQSVDEVSAARLAHPLPMFMVGLDKLREYKGGDVRALLIDEEQVMYPLAVNGEARAALVVRKRANGEYSASSFGDTVIAGMVQQGRQGLTKARGIAESDFRLIAIPAMGAKFLGHEEGGALMLTALYDLPGTSFRQGEPHRAEEVLAAFQPLAAKMNPDVPN